jgi:uncharacterized OsmC-like protein
MQAENNPVGSEPKKPRREAVPRNGVDTPTLFATIDAVKQQPTLGRAQFRASNRWIQGTHSQTRLESWSGAGGEQRHVREFAYDADHPAVLCGKDEAITPIEFLLHALASCLTAGIANIAAARGVTLSEVSSEVEGDIDLQGILGLSNEVRNGYERMRVRFRIKGDAPLAVLRQIVDQSRARSAVFDVITNRVPIEIAVDQD